MPNSRSRRLPPVRLDPNGHLYCADSKLPGTQFHLWHVLLLTTVVCIVCASPSLLAPVLFIGATAGFCAARFLDMRPSVIVLWTAATPIAVLWIVLGIQLIWLIERHEYLGNSQAASFDNWDFDRAPGLLRWFHEPGYKSIGVYCPYHPPGSPEPYCVTYVRKLFPEATIIVSGP